MYQLPTFEFDEKSLNGVAYGVAAAHVVEAMKSHVAVQTQKFVAHAHFVDNEHTQWSGHSSQHSSACLLLFVVNRKDTAQLFTSDYRQALAEGVCLPLIRSCC